MNETLVEERNVEKCVRQRVEKWLCSWGLGIMGNELITVPLFAQGEELGFPFLAVSQVGADAGALWNLTSLIMTEAL